MMNAIEKGFAILPVPEAVRATALGNLRAWLQDAEFEPYRAQLQRLVEHERWAFLLDSFYRTIPFGTGGRRGAVGIGTNRINQYTVSTSVQGHADYLRHHFGSGPLQVVVAFDCRIFHDLRAQYAPNLPNPLLGMRSRDFARLATEVYAANGISVCTVTGDDLLLSTPELSFAIRRLGAAGGLNVSASHNHPDDNGAKFYTDYGGQPVAPNDEEMADAVAAVRHVRSMPFDRALQEERVTWWSAADHEAYIDANLERSISPDARGAIISYSPLNGTGRRTVHDVLAKAGFEVVLVPGQAEYDGEFSQVKYRIPNPEVPEALEAAVAEARRIKADAAFATDPDADRLGVVVMTATGDRFLTGNEIAVLLAAYIIEERAARGTLPQQAFVAKTCVTTELISAIAEEHHVTVIGDLLVGFKYVAALLETLAHTGCYEGVLAGPESFLLAVEESNGVLVTPALRDKDAAGGALLLAERIALLKREGKTLVDDLERILDCYGRYAQGSYSLVMEGVIGLQRIEDMMTALRQQAAPAIVGRSVTRRIDYWDERAHGPMKSSTDRASRNVLAMYFDRGLKITVRPSGTEPKLKIYAEVGGKQEQDSQLAIDKLAREATLQMAEHLLGMLGVCLPRHALALSQLVSVENRIDFAERFLGELRQQLESGVRGSELEKWLEGRLSGYGKDGRFLVAPGIRACLDLGVADLKEYSDMLREVFQLRSGQR